MATGSFVTQNYSRSQSEVPRDLHKVLKKAPATVLAVISGMGTASTHLVYRSIIVRQERSCMIWAHVIGVVSMVWVGVATGGGKHRRVVSRTWFLQAQDFGN
ncbi:hypothetical protein TNCV_4381081 [Trichonephila clavipes]|nr:hypothetical protein TNCV_4381081 [Trichonephila clavipes]